MVYSGVGGVDAAIFDLIFDARCSMLLPMLNAGVGLLLFKEREDPSRESSRLSSGVLHAYLLGCIRDEGFNYRLQLLPGQLDCVLSPIIVLAIVVSLYITFALSSDRRYLQAIFFY
jgi:hypothetical protein